MKYEDYVRAVQIAEELTELRSNRVDVLGYTVMQESGERVFRGNLDIGFRFGGSSYHIYFKNDVVDANNFLGVYLKALDAKIDELQKMFDSL